MKCADCSDTGWTHEACQGRFATGDNRRPDGICGESCGADECALLCHCSAGALDPNEPEY